MPGVKDRRNSHRYDSRVRDEGANRTRRATLSAARQMILEHAYAAFCSLMGARTEAIFEVLRRAADSSSELASLWDQVERNRRLGAAMVVRHEVDIRALTITCGWSTAGFERWLSRQIAPDLAIG